MVVVIFRSRLRDDAGPEYGLLAQRMLELARTMPGFISFRHYEAEDGERVSIIEWENEETLAAWRNHPEHRHAQKRGREQFYAEFHMQVLTPVRAYEFHYEPTAPGKSHI
jgi:heme-degrading monooxygenase HmoA